MTILSGILSHLQSGFVAVLFGLFSALYLAYRGKTKELESTKLKLAKTQDDAQLSNLKTQEVEIGKKVEADDAQRAQLEKTLEAQLNPAAPAVVNPPSSSSAAGSPPALPGSK